MAKDDSDNEDGGDEPEDDEGDVVPVGRDVELGVEVMPQITSFYAYYEVDRQLLPSTGPPFSPEV